jgi:two-component system OmpR family sensor kinase
VEYSYNTPPDVPKRYAVGQLDSYWNNEWTFPYLVYIWIEEKNGKWFTLLYGEPNEMGPLLETVKHEGKLLPSGDLFLPSQTMSRLQQLGGYVQLLDAKGLELASYNRPPSAITQYSVREFVLRSTYSDRYGMFQHSSFNPTTQQTWVISLPIPEERVKGNSMLFPGEERAALYGIIFMFVAILLVLLLLSLWQAHRFVSPMLHMLAWLDKLGKAVYKEPTDSRGVHFSRKRSGKWRRQYRIFADVLHSIEQLSHTLQRDQTLRQQTDTLREEWIAGITHDLKTPLSSIQGYAHLLAEDKYEWSQEEVHKFSNIMLDKSAHMVSLISDLELTYRLKAGIRPPETDEVELNAWLRDSLHQAAASPHYGDAKITFHPAHRTVVMSLYTPWLERVINNLTANALLHNPPGTTLTVSLIVTEQGSVTIQFIDNGTGMDEHTLNILFERYYRGTDTSTTPNGTGLGMAVSKGLIEAMGGKITVETKLGEGTTISLTWPASS